MLLKALTPDEAAYHSGYRYIDLTSGEFYKLLPEALEHAASHGLKVQQYKAPKRRKR